MTAARQELARWGEALAAGFLAAQCYEILERNVRTPYGELDLIACREDVTVFVEVKTRASGACGLPEASVTPAKQAHILASAQHYLQTHPDRDGDWRVDVIAIRRFSQRSPEIVHFENALHT